MLRLATAKVLLAAGVAIGCLSPSTVFAQCFVTEPVDPYYSNGSLESKEVIALKDSKSSYDTPDHWLWSLLIHPLERPWDPYWNFPDYPW